MLPDLPFDFDHCRELLLRAVTDAIHNSSDVFDAIVHAGWGDEPPLRGCSVVNGLSLDICPWDEYLALSIRLWTDPDESRYCLADWRHCNFATSQQSQFAALQEAIRYISSAYTAAYDISGNNPRKSQEIAHLAFLAGAEALLDKSVVSALGSQGIRAPLVEDSFPKAFEYLVFDFDKTIAANYCEIVIANRVTHRLLGRIS